MLLVLVGFIFASFDNEGERYQDLKTNQIQEKERLVELGEEVPQNVLGAYGDLIGTFSMMVPIIIGAVVLLSVLLSLGRR